MKLHLYVIPCDDKTKSDVHRCIESCGLSVDVVTVLPHRNLHKFHGRHRRDWWGYLYSNEWFQNTLDVSLPVFLEYDYEVLHVYKRVVEHNVLKAFVAPRFFRKEVQLRNDSSMLPLTEVTKANTILDGFIYETDR